MKYDVWCIVVVNLVSELPCNERIVVYSMQRERERSRTTEERNREPYTREPSTREYESTYTPLLTLRNFLPHFSASSFLSSLIRTFLFAKVFLFSEREKRKVSRVGARLSQIPQNLGPAQSHFLFFYPSRRHFFQTSHIHSKVSHLSSNRFLFHPSKS